MHKRIITSIVLFIFASLVLIYSHVKLGSVFFLLYVDALAAVGLYEFYSIVEKKGGTSLMAFGMVAGVTCCTVSFFTSDNPVVTLKADLFDVVLVAIIVGFFITQFLRRDKSSVIHNFGGTIAGMFYVAWLLAFAAKINYFPGLGPRGSWYVAMLVAAVKGGDSAACLFGYKFGRRKLSPTVSPKKTLEGSFAHIVTSIAVVLVFKFIWVDMTIIQAAVVGVSLSVVAQFGDLAESLLKRDANIKDSGGQFPGVGGVLDLVDSILFTLPVLYYLMRFWLI